MTAALGLIAAVAFGIWSNSHQTNPQAVPATTTPEDTASPPFTLTVQQHLSGRCATYLFQQTIDELGPPPAKTTPWGQWVKEHHGIDVGTAKFLMNIRGTTAAPVTITSLEIEVVERRPGDFTGGTVVTGQCGGPVTGRLVLFDLDSDPPKIVSSQANPSGQWADTSDQLRFNLVPLEFPYEVTDTDTELLMVFAKTKEYISFRLRLGWTDGSRSGIHTIDNAGEPFAATSVSDSGVIYQTYSDDEWIERNMQDRTSTTVRRPGHR
ncbi:hypothetical protein ACW9HR_36535 [Nocardia gipuzkoensis]